MTTEPAFFDLRSSGSAAKAAADLELSAVEQCVKLIGDLLVV